MGVSAFLKKIQLFIYKYAKPISNELIIKCTDVLMTDPYRAGFKMLIISCLANEFVQVKWNSLLIN
jgi:hypothetical protein